MMVTSNQGYNDPAAPPPPAGSKVVVRSMVPIPKDPNFKLEGVIVCNHFSDFLVRTLPTNKYLFDKLVVVTAPEDEQTARVCEFYHVQCKKTDVLRSRWDEFYKGAAINVGLKELSQDGWVVQLDADIYLPPQTRMLLQMMNLDPEMVHGVDRFDVIGYVAWDKFTAMPVLQHEDETYIHPNSFPLGTRVMFKHSEGWVPLGFFQLWHPRASGVNNYPEAHGTAGRTDTLFSQQWPRAMRSFLPEIICYHLESGEAAAMGANWEGRTTASFAFNPVSLNEHWLVNTLNSTLNTP